MTRPEPDHSYKADLIRYLQESRDALLWKLDGLSEYDARRPLTPTGTNLLGLVKHLAGVELGYFGDAFGRPYFTEEALPAWWWTRATDPHADMYTTPDESREEITGLYRRAWEHAKATFDALDLDAVGQVPWWPEERREVTLHHLMTRVAAETQRHAGHADILRELMDGEAGLLKNKDALAPGDAESWALHRERVERAARQADVG
ncbi:DinB family protein [Streptomyces sp. BBFR102]|uniref:DinB family protein n=1 Tax=Streptomyces sp. BBFR102 TaxID=3448171 RepID=UPI003F52E507